MASGDTLFVFSPEHNQPPTSNFATLDTRNNHPVLDFDDTTNESAIFSSVLPQSYAGGGLTVLVGFSMTSATTGDVDLQAAIERVEAGVLDIDADSFASAQSVIDVSVPGTSGFVAVATITFTDGAQMDSLAVGEKFRIKITRDAATDTASGDLELHFVEIRET